jgi:hypothetical protein
MITDETVARVTLEENHNNASKWDGLSLSPNTHIVPCFVLYFLCIQPTHHPTFYLYRLLQTTPRPGRFWKKNRQAEAILKEFAKCTAVLRGDPSANLLAIHNMMSPGRRIMRSSALKGQEQKVVATTPNKNKFLQDAMPMFNDPVLLWVRP